LIRIAGIASTRRAACFSKALRFGGRVVDEQDLGRFRASTRRWLVGSFSGWVTLLLCLVGIGFLIILRVWLKFVSTRYELTDQRLVIHRGILMKSTDEIELYRIKDVRVDYSLLNQISDIGTITLTSSDRTTGGRPFSLDFIPRARARRDELRQLVDRSRRRRRVREFDVD
jgi:uncharacterized membrane protein YdbT with pleckstrin-like domain